MFEVNSIILQSPDQQHQVWSPYAKYATLISAYSTQALLLKVQVQSGPEGFHIYFTIFTAQEFTVEMARQYSCDLYNTSTRLFRLLWTFST
jgi:hypothetical protein